MPVAGFLMILPFLNRVVTDPLLSFTILIESVRLPRRFYKIFAIFNLFM
jgi:hypothetical protein